MSKSTKIIAGVSALALAAAFVPAVATFALATDVTTDTATYSLTIDDSTTLGNLETKTGYFEGTTVTNVANGTAETPVDTQGATVTTNDKDGFTLSVKGSVANEGALKNSDGKVINAGTSGDASYWYIGYTTSDSNITVTDKVAPAAADQTAASSTKAVSKAAIASTFNYMIDDVQEAGTYTETVTYTLAAN